MTIAALVLSRRDLEFLLIDWLKADALISRPRFSEHSLDTFSAALDLAEELAVQ